MIHFTKNRRSRNFAARLVFVFAIALVLGSQALGAPFAEWLEHRLADGRLVRIWGEGDEFDAAFETEAGLSIRYNPALGEYEYVALDAATGALVGTGVRLGEEAGNEQLIASLPQHLRDTSDAHAREVQARIDEHEAVLRTTEKWRDVREQTELRNLAMKLHEDGYYDGPMPTSVTVGDVYGITLLVDFPITNSVGAVTNTLAQTVSSTITPEVADAWMNREAPFANGRYSVRKYYQIVSDGALNYTNVVIGWIRVPHPREYYDDSAQGCGQCGRLLIGDALDALKALPNYASEYYPLIRRATTDSSGYGKALNVIFAGNTASRWNYGLWAHKWTLSYSEYNKITWTDDNGKTCRFYTYQITPAGNGATVVSSTLHHENGHMVCGFPDLYHYNSSTYGVGYWDIMSSSNGQAPNAYLRAGAGWVTPKTLPQSGWVTVTTDRQDVWEFKRPSSSSESFFIENRQNAGVDSALPGSGILIWRVNRWRSNTTATQLSSYNADHPATNRWSNEVSLEQADGIYQLERRISSGNPDDAWHAGNASLGCTGVFDNDSAACSRWEDGTASGLKLSHFSDIGSTMRFLVGEVADCPEPVSILTCTATNDTSITWSVSVETFGKNCSSAQVVVDFGSDHAMSSVISNRVIGSMTAVGTASFTLSGIPTGAPCHARLRLTNTANHSAYANTVSVWVPSQQPILYVNANAAGQNNGSSWANAFTDLQSALARCAENEAIYGKAVQEIWVAAGTYKPGDSRSATFSIGREAKLYGGFAGGETSRDERDWIANKTYLSGEIGDPDSIYDNVNTILCGTALDVESTVDGFIIEKAYTGYDDDNYSYCGAIRAHPTSSNDYKMTSFMILDHCLIVDNISSNYYYSALNGPLVVRNSVIAGNTNLYVSASGGGGGICHNVRFEHCTLTKNKAGGTIVYYGSMLNTIVWDNVFCPTSTDKWKGDVYNNSYYMNDASYPMEGYQSTVWTGQDSDAKPGQRNTNNPNFGIEPTTGLPIGLPESSPAVNIGSTANLNWLNGAKDFLGNPRVYGAAPDLGAIEFSAPNEPEFTSVVPGDPTAASISVAVIMKQLGKGAASDTLDAQVSTAPSFQTVAAHATATVTEAGTACSMSVTGLAAATTYYLRVIATSSTGFSSTSETFAFTTLDATAPAFTATASADPEVETRGVVTINVISLGDGAASGTATVEVSEDPGFSSPRTFACALSGAGAAAVPLTRLGCGTAYHVRVTVTNDRGVSTTRSGGAFTTRPASYYAAGLMQARTTCGSNAYPSFDFVAADDPAAEVAPGPIMADTTGSAVNSLTGKTWTWGNNTTFYYEGEMFFAGGVTYNFFHCIDDGLAIELDGEAFTRQATAGTSGYNAGVTKASKTYAEPGWRPIRIWVYDWTGGKGFVAGKIGFSGVGLGWNTNGVTEVSSGTQSSWSTLRDPGDASLLRVLSPGAIPSLVTLEDDLMVSGGTLAGTVTTDAIESGCTVTLYAGTSDAGSNTAGWAQSLPLGEVPTEPYSLPFQWEGFCEAGEESGWLVIARIANASGTYEGWSLIREPSAGNVFAMGIMAGEAGLGTLTVTPRVAGFGEAGAPASVEVEYSADAGFAQSSRTAAVTASSTNWLPSVTLSGLAPNTTYYVRSVGTIGGETATSRALELRTLDYGEPAVSMSVGATTIDSIPVSWSLTSLGLGNASADVFLDYGTSESYGSSVKIGSCTGAGGGVYTLGGLAGETAYRLRVRAVASPSGKSGATPGATASTQPVGDPEISASLGAVTQFAATFSYSLSSLGDGGSSATVYCDLSTSASFSPATTRTVASGVTAAMSGSETVAGLAAETAYHLRVRAVNQAGKTGTSAALTFTTPAVGTPELSLYLTEILQRAASLEVSVSGIGEAASSAAVLVDYGPTASYGSTVTVAGPITGAGTYPATIGGLQPETRYYIRARVVNDAGKEGFATDSFTTLEPANPAFTHSVTPSYTAASFSVDVTKLGNGATSAAGYIRWSLSPGLSPALGTAEIPRVASPGAVAASVTGLGTGTTYYYELAITNNLAGIHAVTNSFTTEEAGSVALGTGYYEGGLVMGYMSGAQQWGVAIDKPAMVSATHAASGAAASFARGAISAYAGQDDTFVNEVDGLEYSFKNGSAKWCRWWSYEGEMWMEAGRTYNFALCFFKAAALMIDGEEVASEDNGGAQAPTVRSYTPSATGWHSIKYANGSDGNGGGACANPWNGGSSSPFHPIKYGLAWNTNGTTTVSASNTNKWSRMMDAGDRRLFRARGTKPPMAFLDGVPSFTATTMSVPVRIDSTMDGCTVRVYASRSPDCWYFEERWEKVAAIGSVGSGASVVTADFTGVDTSSDWYVSARLTDSGGYDQWTDAVRYTPVIDADTAPAIGAVTAAPGRTSAEVSAAITDLGEGSDGVTVRFDASASASFSVIAATASATLGAPGAAEATLSGLAEGTRYYLRVTATGSNGLSATDTGASFTTGVTAPPAGSVAVSDVSFTSARATLTVTELGDDTETLGVTFEYSGDSSFAGKLTLEGAGMTAPGSQSVTLDGLAPGTTYHVRAALAGGVSALTPAVSFATPAHTAPAIGAVSATAGRSTASASVQVTSLGEGSDGVTVTAEVSASQSFDVVAASQSAALVAPGSAAFSFSGLAEGTRYYLRVTATGSNGLSATDTGASFTTGVTAPPAGSVAVSDVSFTSARATLTVTELGDDTDTLGVTFEYSSDASFAGKLTLEGAGMTATGSQSVILDGLAPGTTYHVRAALAGGVSALTPAVSFATAEPSVSLANASAEVDASATSATLSVEVAELSAEMSSMTLTLNGEAVRTWSPIAPGTYSHTAPVARDSTNSYSFAATADGASASLGGTFVAATVTGWFDVRFGDEGYILGPGFTDVSGVTDPGGVWTKLEDDATELVLDEGGKHLRLSTGVERLAYTPSSASKAGCDVRIEGRARIRAGDSAPADELGQLAGLTFAAPGEAVAAYGYAGGAWLELSGLPAAVSDGSWVDYAVEFDMSSASAPRVRYSAGGAALSSGGSQWLAVGGSAARVTGVEFKGDGGIGDFRGFYYATGGGGAPLERPVIASGGGLSLSGDELTIRVSNGVKDAWYTVYASEEVAGPYAAVKSVRCAADGELSIGGVDASRDRMFYRLVAGSAQVADGTVLSE